MNRLCQEREQMYAEVKHMFEQLLLKMEGCNPGKVVVELLEEAEKSKGDSSASEAKSFKSIVCFEGT